MVKPAALYVATSEIAKMLHIFGRVSRAEEEYNRSPEVLRGVGPGADYRVAWGKHGFAVRQAS